MAASPCLLIHGASSAVGHCLLPRLQARGWRIHARSRRPPPVALALPAIDWVEEDLREAAPAPAGTTHILSLGPCDLFVDWLARQAVAPGLRQVIAFGSTSVATKLDSPSPAERELAARLLAGERGLAEECRRLGLHWTLLRPTLIYGGGQDLVARIAALAARWRVCPRLHGAAARALRQPVHVADLAEAVLAAIDNPQAQDRAFDLPGGETLSLKMLVERAARSGGRWLLPLPLPLGWLLTLAHALGLLAHSSALGAASLMRMARDQCFDAAPARAALGFEPGPFRP